MNEFELIRRHFVRPDQPLPPQVALGVGDDCALLQVSAGHRLAISSDMLVEGRHFFSDVHPQALGHKALAVNLSDLAAMGARPLGFTLALALPAADDAWLQAFAQGLFALADAHGCPLVGGDTTRGPLNLCITVFGELTEAQALRRSAARAGDDLYLSGSCGDARLALEWLLGRDWAREAVGPTLPDALRARLERPQPRLALGRALAGLAHAAIDLSDGLAGDLGHVLTASGVGADVEYTALPASPAVRALPLAPKIECLLYGGDDYELLFTAAPDRRAAIAAAAQASQTPVQRIGRLTAEPGLRLHRGDGAVQPLATRGFDHFGPATEPVPIIRP